MAVGLARRVAARLALDVALAGSADVLLYSTPLPSSSSSSSWWPSPLPRAASAPE